MKIIIDRAKWATVYKNKLGLTILNCGRSLLLNSDRGMCCLGFVCVAKDIKENTLLGVAYPKSLEIKVELLNYQDKYGLFHDSEFSKYAAHLNDFADLTPSEKEKNLINLFKENNIELVFEGKYSEEVCEAYPDDIIIMEQTGRLIEN